MYRGIWKLFGEIILPTHDLLYEGKEGGNTCTYNDDIHLGTKSRVEISKSRNNSKLGTCLTLTRGRDLLMSLTKIFQIDLCFELKLAYRYNQNNFGTLLALLCELSHKQKDCFMY